MPYTNDQIGLALTDLLARVDRIELLDALQREITLFEKEWTEKTDPTNGTPLTDAQRISIVTQMRTFLSTVAP